VPSRLQVIVRHHDASWSRGARRVRRPFRRAPYVDRHAGRGGSRRAGCTGRRHGAELESGDRVQGDVLVCIVARWCAPW